MQRKAIRSRAEQTTDEREKGREGLQGATKMLFDALRNHSNIGAFIVHS